MSPLARRSLAIAALAVTLVLVAVLALRGLGVGLPIGPWVSPTPVLAGSPSPLPQGDDTLAAVAAEVTEVRQLPAASLAPPELVSREELVARLADLVEADWPPVGFPREDLTLRALGLLPEGDTLPDLIERLYASGVVGYFDSATDRIVLVGDSDVDVATLLAYAHEVTHALQDAALPGTPDPGAGDLDARLAWLALREGDASTAMVLWGVDHLSVGEMLGAGGAQAPSGLGVPAWMVEVAELPYLAGATFVAELYASGGWDAVDVAYDQPPLSVEQVLHYDRYVANDEPVTLQPAELAAALGDGWSLVEETTMGEAWLHAWLGAQGATARRLEAAAAGWDGDRLSVLSGPSGAWAASWALAWDVPLDAEEFATAYGEIEAADGVATRLVQVGELESVVLRASSPDLLASLAAALGL